MERKTDEEVFREYLAEMEQSYPTDQKWAQALIGVVKECRKDEPRINSGVHLIDYMNICDEDDTMDTFYGPDYFKE